MTAEPCISVIMPVYGAERWLRRAVDSLLAQTVTDFELILVDDESPDSCGAICDEYAAADPRVRVIHQKNSGCAGASNTGIEQARGRWLMFMDDDDQVSPFLMEYALDEAQAHPGDFILWKYCMGADGLMTRREEQAARRVTLYTPQQLGHLYIHGWFGATWAMLFDRRLLQENGPRFDTTLRNSEDLPFVFQYARTLFTRYPEGQIRMLEDGLYFYDNEDKAGSLSRQFPPGFCDNWCRTFDLTLAEAEGFFHIPPADSCAIYQNYLRTIGVGLYSILCLETGPLNERRTRARAFLAGPRADRLRRVFRQRKYLPRYGWPRRLRWLKPFAVLGRMQEENQGRYLTWQYRGQAVHDLLYGRIQ